MIKFMDKRNNLIKYAYSAKEIDNKMIIQFEEDGKEYKYDKHNIELFNEDVSDDFVIYKFNRKCYKCGKETTIYTYLKFDNGEDLIYPWDKHRLNREKSMESEFIHMFHEEIEMYPINIIGSDERLDEIMLKKFPDKIKEEYSSTQKRIYPMNICKHCGTKQGEFFIYKELNKKIRDMEELEIYNEDV